MGYHVYVLRSGRDGQLYTGVTNNLKDRLKRHNEGRVKSTRFRRPFKLVYSEEYSDKSDAYKREYFFKTVEGQFVKKQLINRRGVEQPGSSSGS